MKNKLLPQKLKELRKVNNYTQDYVAEKIKLLLIMHKITIFIHGKNRLLIVKM